MYIKIERNINRRSIFLFNLHSVFKTVQFTLASHSYDSKLKIESISYIRNFDIFELHYKMAIPSKSHVMIKWESQFVPRVVDL